MIHAGEAAPWLNLAGLLVLDSPLFWLAGWGIFGDWEHFFECVRFWFTPDIVSMFRGEYWDDWWGELKMFVWLGACLGLLAVEIFYLSRWLPFPVVDTLGDAII